MKNTHLFKLVLALSMNVATSAQAFDMTGMISYNIGQLSQKPTTYVEKSNSIGYAFFGRLDLGPGQLESGFHYVPVSITTQKSFGEVKTSGSYWILPLMYRFTFLPPFFSFALGVDYAVEGNTKIDVGGTLNGSGGSSGYRSHFGYQGSLAAAQDLGENLSAVLDFRYRGGLGEAIAFDGVNTKYNFFTIALGLQKHLD